MKIVMAGSGYVGLTTGACLAELGNSVVCCDIDEAKIAVLNQGKVPILEPGLPELIKKNVKAGRLRFSTDLKSAVKEAEVVFICVGTPPKANGDADLSYIEAVAKDIGAVMDGYKLIVEKSTVPVETAQWVKKTIQRYAKSDSFDVASNPEFLSEGSAVRDFMQPDRVVVGVESSRAADILKKLYASLNAPIIVTDLNSAELIKHASNAFLSMKISFINAVARICELTGADVKKVAEGIGYDRRIGNRFLNAGIGYGGFCFPKDLAAFIRIAEKQGYDFKLLKAVAEINEKQRELFIKKVEKALWNLRGKTLAVLGLSFKPDTDDMREASSIYIINALQNEGARIKAYCPGGMENARKILKDVTYCKDAYDACNEADAALIITEWEEFRNLDLEKVKSLLNTPIIIDGRNIFEPEEMEKLGFIYYCIGRGGED